MLGGEPAAQAEVARGGEPGELPQLVVEVGLVVVAGPVGDLRPVDVAGGVGRPDDLGEAVRPREALRSGPHQVLEPGGEVGAADADRRSSGRCTRGPFCGPEVSRDTSKVLYISLIGVRVVLVGPAEVQRVFRSRR